MSGVNAVAIKALVEHEPAENRTSVEVELAVAERHRAHAEIGIHFIERRFARFQREFKVVKVALSQIPQVQFAKFEVESDVTATKAYRLFSHNLAVKASRGGKRDVLGARSIEFDCENRALDDGSQAEKVDMLRLDRFHPNRLPDAGGARVMTAARVGRGRLFARAVLAVPYVVLGEHREVIALAREIIGNIETKRPIAAGVHSHELAVYIHISPMVDCAEMQYLALAVETCRKLKVAAVKYGVHKSLVAHSRQLALGCERHDYFTG